MAGVNKLLNKLLDYIQNKPPPDTNRNIFKPLPSNLNIVSSTLKKALILGFPFYTLLDTDECIGDAKGAERFIRQIAPNCTIHTLYEQKFDKYTQGTNNGVTVQMVKDELVWLSDSIQPGETVFLYYAGHGSIRLDDQKYIPRYTKNSDEVSKIYAGFLTSYTYYITPYDYSASLDYTIDNGQYTSSGTNTSNTTSSGYGYAEESNPENPNINDELTKYLFNYKSQQTEIFPPKDYCMVVPEFIWIDKADVADYERTVYYLDNGSYEQRTVGDTLVAGSERTITLSGASAEDKEKYGLPDPHWNKLPDSVILIRDDEIRDTVINRLPEGSKALLCFSSCNSAGAGDLKYEMELLGVNGTTTNIYNFFTGNQIDKHLFGLTHTLNGNQADTSADVLVISAARANEEAMAYSSDEITSFLHTIINNFYRQWSENTLRRKINKTAINIKSLYGDFYNKVPDSLPQITSGKNLLPANNNGSTLYSFDSNNTITVGGFTIRIDNNFIYVNNQQIFTYKYAKQINGKKVYFIQNSNNRTIVLGDYEYDIIPSSAPGSPYLLDIPIMFDFCS